MSTVATVGRVVSNLLLMSHGMRQQWKAVVHYQGGKGDNHCLVRIFSNGVRAVVVLTELAPELNSVPLRCQIEVVAARMRLAIAHFIPGSSWPDKVTWLVQRESAPSSIESVTMVWDEKDFAHPTWRAVSQGQALQYGVAWNELCNVRH